MPAEGKTPTAIAAGFRSTDLILVGDGEFAKSIDLLARSAATSPRRLWIGKQPDPSAAKPTDVLHITNTEELISIVGNGYRARVFFAARMSQSNLFRGDKAAAVASMFRGDFTTSGQLRALADHLTFAGYVPSRFADVLPDHCLRVGECIGPPCDHAAHRAATANGRAALQQSQGTVALLGIDGDLLHKSGRAMTADDYFESSKAKKTTSAKLAYIKSRMPLCPLDDEVITPGLVAKIADLVKIAIVAPGMLMSDRAAVLRACADNGLALCAAQEA